MLVIGKGELLIKKECLPLRGLLKCKILGIKSCPDIIPNNEDTKELNDEDIKKINEGIKELRATILGEGHHPCFRQTSEYGVKKKEFYNLLDLHNMNDDFSNNLHALYEVYVHLHNKKCYTQMEGSEYKIKTLFYEVCCSVGWRNKNTIISFLQIAKIRCSSDRTTRWTIFHPALMSFVISLITSVVCGMLIDINEINLSISWVLKCIILVVIVFIAAVAILILIRYLFYGNMKRTLIEESNRYIVIENFLTLCERSVEK